MAGRLRAGSISGARASKRGATAPLPALLGWWGERSPPDTRGRPEAAAPLTVAFLPQGVEVQTDYVPLLNSLAAYGWQLTCVLPTPVVKTDR